MIIYYTDKYTGSRKESRRLLERSLGVHTGDEELAKTLIGALKKGEHGKPYIDGFSCFSISHTGSFWAVLIADRECGLDIQAGRKCDMRAIAKRWFAPEDAEAISADSESAADEFFCVWTRREALAKALGGTVYDTDLPAVLPGEADISGRHYKLADIAFPGSCSRDTVQIYAAVCIEGNSSGLQPEIRALLHE